MVIAAINSTIVNCAVLNARAIAAMGMYILGDTVWAVVEPSVDAGTTWDSFKASVESPFKLSTLYLTWDLD